jgi:hypothetical protein
MNRAALGRCVVATVFTLAAGCEGGVTTQVTPPPPTPSLSAPPALPPSLPAVLGGACPAPSAPKNPVEYGQCVLAAAEGRAKSAAKVSVLLASDPAAAGIAVEAPPESYSVVTRADQTLVVGRDEVGAMYGALDLAERLDQQGASALPLPSPVTARPFTQVRAANLFLVLPEPNRPWWFRDPTFWTEYLDMMARARLNFLDMHGMYYLETTIFPNALLYFATSATMPNEGIPKAEREANLAVLNQVIAMATMRGIKVGLMSYRADLSLLGDEKEDAEEKAEAPVYTREAVADLASRAPGLSYIGFRVGESRRKAEWYTSTYVAGLKDAHTHAIAYTRTWLTTKKQLLTVVEASGPETLVEVKYNGEQFGPPYPISGGGMERWSSYSYEDYLDPPTPYRFVFQVRAGGTHRIFRYASYERTRRAVLTMNLSPKIAGFSLEAAHAYLPQRDFYHANPADSFSPWAFRRDELSYLLFGRLGYDPTTPESVFRGMLRLRVGTDGLWDAVQAASDITPWILTGFTCGPDQRDDAPELDLDGSVAFWATPPRTKGQHAQCNRGHQAFDGFAMAEPYEAASDLLEQRGTSRISPVDLALTVLADAKQARTASTVAIDPSNVEARDVVRECTALADLGEWFAHKYRGATALAVYQGSGSAPWLEAARRETAEADAAFTQLASDTAYIAPFDENMRMRKQDLPHFHWKNQLVHLAEDMTAIDQAAYEMREHKTPSRAKGPLPNPKAWLTTPRHAGPGLANLDVSPADPHAASWTVTVTLAAPAPRGAVVRVLHRPFRSDGHDWESVDATGSGTTWTATAPGKGEGGLFAVEVNAGPGNAWRYPDVMKEMPYKPLAP